MNPLLPFVLLLTTQGEGALSGAPRDVPRDHWAFPAVDRLFREGLLKGYPDGTFKGARPASRYEMAAMLDRLNSDEQLVSLQRQITELKNQTGGGLSAAERQEIERKLATLREEVAALKREQDEIQELTDRMQKLLENLRALRRGLKG